MNNDKYDVTILELTQVMSVANVSQTVKGEFFGYFLDRLIHRYIQIPEGRGDLFNANLFPAATRKSLDLLSSRLATTIGSADPVEAADGLRYVIVQVLDTISLNIKYGMLLFFKGCVCKTLTKVQAALDTALSADPKERVMTSRRRVVALGVLADVMNHTPQEVLTRREDVWRTS